MDDGEARACGYSVGERKRPQASLLPCRDQHASWPAAAGAAALPTFDPVLVKHATTKDDENGPWPPQSSLAAAFAMSMVPTPDPRYTADWAAEVEKDTARRAATEKRWAEQEAARQAEAKRQYEASLRR
jgi:hypothetical protein